MNGLKSKSPRNVVALLAAFWVLGSAAFGAETPLTNGVALTGLSGTTGGETFYKIDVPAGQDQLEILTTGGTGDVDLYVRRGSLPTITAYDYRPYKVGNEETVTVTSPAAGTWYIMLRGFSAYAGVTLKATYSAAVTVVTLTNGVPKTGLSGAVSSEQFFKIDVPAGQSKLEITISGGTGDADLYVRKDTMPTRTVYDYRPYLVGSEETVAVDNPPAGTWYIMIHGYAAFSGLTLLASYGGGAGTELENGVPVTGISDVKDSERLYRIDVPASQTSLEIEISGGTGDADLYVKLGARPTTSDYDYRPYLAGNDEKVSITDPASGTYYIVIRGYADYANVTLKATYADVLALEDGVPVANLAGALNSETFFKFEVPSGQNYLQFQTYGGTGDCDLYVRRGVKPTTATYDLRLNAIGNTGAVGTSDPQAGIWYVMLKGKAAFSGVTLVADYSVLETVTTLSNGVAVPNITGAEGSEKLYKITVPAGQTKLEVKISGGTGDADLYVRKGDKPTVSAFDYRPYLVGNDETVTVDNPAAGDWYIMIRGYHSYSGLTLLATYTGGPVPEDVVTLQNGVAVTGISGAASAEKFYKIAVPAGQAKLEIVMTGGTGDADLYVKKGAKPTYTDWDYRPYLIGSNETVTIDNPAAATWYIMIRGYAAFSGVSLTATYFPVPESVTALTNGVPVTGLSGAASSEKFYKIDVPAGQEFLNIEISGGTGDADLYVKKGAKPTDSSWDYRPYLVGNNEKVEIANPAAATWYILVRGYQAYANLTLVAEYGLTAGNKFSTDPNCVALWRFEPTKLTVDSIGTNTLTNINAVPANTTTFKEGLAAADFEADSKQYFTVTDVNLANAFPLKNGNTDKKISVCFWFRLESLGRRYLWCKSDETKTSLTIYIEGGSGMGGKYYVFMRKGYNNGLSFEQTWLTTMTISTGQWYHLVVTYDDTTKAYRMRVYDQEADVASERTGSFANSIAVTKADIRIGASPVLAELNYLDGLMDECVIFNDVLTAAEIDKVRLGTYGKP